jgi:formylglycine-generating enzyme required for sulfatase activity
MVVMPRAGILFALLMIAAPPLYAADRPPSPLTAAEERALKPRDSFRECDVCPEMVVVPAGSFMMGSPLSEQGRNDNEGPQFQVTFSQQFGVGRFAVKFAEWDACVSNGGCNGYQPEDRAWGRGTRPVINVSWTDAKTYVADLCRMALAQDREDLSSAQRIRARIRDSCRNDDAVLVGFINLDPASKLRLESPIFQGRR